MLEKMDADEMDREFGEALLDLKTIMERCKTANISYTNETDPEIHDIDFKIDFPNGRNTRLVWLLDPDDVSKFKSTSFEKYILVGSYAAIYCAELGQVEAIISAPFVANNPWSHSRLKHTLGLSDENSKITLVSPSETSKFEVSIEATSDALKVLSEQPDRLGLSLIIKNKGVISTHDIALKELHRISNALFFDIDMQIKIYLTLLRNTKRVRESVRGKEKAGITEVSGNSYDLPPMDLYFYARSASTMPLLQFLAYYQAIEFYYPNFYNAELAKKIKNILKNPSFRIGNNGDIMKIVSTIKTKGPGFASEKEQLKATLKECLDNEEILEFLSQSKDRLDFFNSKAKGLTSKTINTQNKNLELHAQVADRMYDIRCKIVHTKGDDADGDIELLLPFSPEAEKLDEDIELVKLVAQKVIICASHEWHL